MFETIYIDIPLKDIIKKDNNSYLIYKHEFNMLNDIYIHSILLELIPRLYFLNNKIFYTIMSLPYKITLKTNKIILNDYVDMLNAYKHQILLKNIFSDESIKISAGDRVYIDVEVKFNDYDLIELLGGEIPKVEDLKYIYNLQVLFVGKRG